MAKLVCLGCGQVNRVPGERLAGGQKCGICGAKLMDGGVTEIGPDVLAKAEKSDEVPLVVDFWAPWCGPCRMMAAEFAKAAALKGRVRFAKINTEDFPQVSARHGLRGIPLLIAFRDGREIGRQAGAQPASGIQAWVQGAVAQTA